MNYLKHQEVERRHAEILLQEQDEEDEDYRLMREEMYRALHRAVDELPERCRQVFKAMYFLRERLGKSYCLLIVLNIISL